jgi:hypothetical protein
MQLHRSTVLLRVSDLNDANGTANWRETSLQDDSYEYKHDRDYIAGTDNSHMPTKNPIPIAREVKIALQWKYLIYGALKQYTTNKQYAEETV